MSQDGAEKVMDEMEDPLQYVREHPQRMQELPTWAFLLIHRLLWKLACAQDENDGLKNDNRRLKARRRERKENWP
jgi:hypothetical protein